MKYGKTFLLAAAFALATATAMTGEKAIIRIGTPKAVNTPIHRGCELIAKICAEKSGGTLEVQLFPAGQIGFERDLIEGLTEDTIDAAWTSTALVGNFEESLALFSLPYVFRDYDHVHNVVDGEIGQKILADLQKNWGIRTVAFLDQGFRHVWNNERPITKIEDVKGMKLRAPESPIYIDTFKLMGANVTVLSWGETYTAIQTKVVAGLEQPMESIVGHKFYEICKYGSFTNHMFAGGLLMIRENLFQSLSPEHQKIFLEACKEGEASCNKEARQIEEEFVKELKANGMVLNEIAPAEIDRFAAAMQPLYDQYANKLGGPDIVARVRAVK